MGRRRDTEAPALSDSFRSAMEEYRSEYDIGGTGRYLPMPRGVQTQGSGADYHYANETKFFRAIERARHFDRNNMVVGQGVNRLAANLVKDGFTLDVNAADDQSASEDLTLSWYDWCEDPEQCDYEGEKNFYQMELMAARAIPVDGDIFPLPLQTKQLQWMEAHRCRRPHSLRRDSCVHGVNLDRRSAKRTSFFFTKEDIGPLGTVKHLSDVVEIQARDDEGHRQVLQLYWPLRFSQRRGVTAFAPVALPIHYHDDIQFANLVAAQMQACWAILEEQKEGLGPNPPPARTSPEAQTGARTSETDEDGSTRTNEGVSPGMRVRAKPGWKIQGFNPTIPGPQFKEHALMVLSIIAINLDLPLVVFLLDATATNFSGWRGAIDQARIRFRVMQRLLIAQFYTPVWKWFVRHRIAEDRTLAKLFKKHGDKIFGHTWHPPTWSYIEPHKDISANALELATLQTSPRRQRARQGEDFNDIVPEIVDDAGKILAAAEAKVSELNTSLKPKEPFTRAELLRLFTAGGVSVSATQQDPMADEQKAATV